jgi:hypothetical protein
VKIRLAGFKGVTVPATVPVPRGKASATVTITTATTTAARRGSITATLGSVRKYPPVPATVTVGRYYDYATVVMVPKKNLSGQYASTVTAKYGGKSLARTITVDPGLSVLQVLGGSGEPDALQLNTLFTGSIPAGGLTVKFASSSEAISLPASYTFPAEGIGDVGTPAARASVR